MSSRVILLFFLLGATGRASESSGWSLPTTPSSGLKAHPQSLHNVQFDPESTSTPRFDSEVQLNDDISELDNEDFAYDYVADDLQSMENSQIIQPYNYDYMYHSSYSSESRGEDALKNPKVVKLLALTNYGSVTMLFFLQVFRSVHHHDMAVTIANPIRRSLVRLMTSALILGNTAAAVGALLRMKNYKALMKGQLSLNAMWELLDLSGNFFGVLFQRDMFIAREELLASMFWNGVIAAICIAYRKVNWF